MDIWMVPDGIADSMAHLSLICKDSIVLYLRSVPIGRGISRLATPWAVTDSRVSNVPCPRANLVDSWALVGGAV